MSKLLTALEVHGRKAQLSGDGWMARCPAHDDRTPSLSVNGGDEGRVLVHCHAGCPPEAVVAALGMTMTDLMPSATARREIVATYPYTDEHGVVLFEVVRFEPKDFRQRSPNMQSGQEWSIRGVRRVLFRLPAVLTAIESKAPIYVVEGEKDVLAAERAGAVATCNPGGAGKWRNEYNEMLRDAHVTVVADRDEVGLAHAQDVARGLRAVAASVRIVEAAAGKDLSDHLTAGLSLDELVPCDEPTHADIPLAWQPFPTHCLPEALQAFVRQGAASLGCDEALIALPLLVTICASVGNRAVLRLKQDWLVPAVLWGGIVTESGQLKSPALDLVIQPLIQRELSIVRNHDLNIEAFDLAESTWKTTPARQRGERPRRPKAPERFIVSDVTTEAVAERLESSPMGLLLSSDELAAWFKGFDAYHQGGRGPDVQRWLSAYDARAWIVDRKSGKGQLAISRAAVSVVGGIQPGILKRVLGNEHFENGLAARLLLIMPPRVQKVWREAEIGSEIQQSYNQLLGKLLDMRPEQELADATPQPRAFSLTASAQALFVDWYNRHARRQNEARGREAAMLSKLESAGARLALAIHMARLAAGDATASPDMLDERSVAIGTQLADWFAGEGLRVYAILGEDAKGSEQRHLIELVRGKFDGRVTERQLRDASRSYRQPGASEAALQSLVDERIGHWEGVPTGPRGGRPTRLFVLDTQSNDPHRSGNPAELPGNNGFRTGPVVGENQGLGDTSRTQSTAHSEGNHPAPDSLAVVRSGNLLEPEGGQGYRTGSPDGSGVPTPEPPVKPGGDTGSQSRRSGPETGRLDLKAIMRSEELIARSVQSGNEAAIHLSTIELSRLIGWDHAEATADLIRREAGEQAA